jgi:nickel-type superoxide dismutase maturation protease
MEVVGESMVPDLRPGDRVVVLGARPREGDLTVARHPASGVLIVKRAGRAGPDGWWLESDNQRAVGRQDSWDFGAVPDELIVGRVVARYRPPWRLSVPRRSRTW